MSSFQKRKEITLPLGTRISIQSKQPITSCGIPSLDYIVGGGLPIGSILMIEEDKFSTYSKVVAKYFLAEGVFSHQKTLLASLDDDPHDMYKKLPSSCEDIVHENASQSGDDMKIAWRYNNLPQVEPLEIYRAIGHNFDLTKPLAKKVLDAHDGESWNGTSEAVTTGGSRGIFRNHRFTSLMKSAVARIQTSQQEQCCHRLCMTSLGSPLWYAEGFEADFIKFLTVLKAIMRNSFGVCLITVPMHLLQLLNENLPTRVRNLVDYSVQLEAFAGSNRETNPVFKEYHGLLNITKMAALNTLNVFTPETTDLAFKLRRRKFVIEKLHLPPELQENDQQQEIAASPSCSDPQKHRLEF